GTGCSYLLLEGWGPGACPRADGGSGARRPRGASREGRREHFAVTSTSPAHPTLQRRKEGDKGPGATGGQLLRAGAGLLSGGGSGWGSAGPGGRWASWDGRLRERGVRR